MLAAHYAPAARVVVADEGTVAQLAAELLARGDGRVGVLAPTVTDGLADGVIELEPAGGPRELQGPGNAREPADADQPQAPRGR